MCIFGKPKVPNVPKTPPAPAPPEASPTAPAIADDRGASRPRGMKLLTNPYSSLGLGGGVGLNGGAE